MSHERVRGGGERYVLAPGEVGVARKGEFDEVFGA